MEWANIMCDDLGTIRNNVMRYVKVLFNTDLLVLLNGESKGKTVPLQAWRGPEVSIRLRIQDFKTVGTRRW